MSKRHPHYLTMQWIRWKKARVAELTEAGIPWGTAYEVAKHETLVRQRVGRILGLEAAMNARLTISKRGGKPHIALTGDLDGVPITSRTTLERIGMKLSFATYLAATPR